VDAAAAISVYFDWRVLAMVQPCDLAKVSRCERVDEVDSAGFGRSEYSDEFTALTMQLSCAPRIL